MLREKVINHPWFNKRVAEYYRWYPKSLNNFDSAMFGIADSKIEGMYIHIPFCDKICRFCPYNKKLSPSDFGFYIKNLIKEIRLYQEQINLSDLKYIYFGGGTPSVLSIDQIDSVLKQINIQSGINDETEISFEAHPTHLNKSYITALKELGINRISTGVQSFDGSRLKIIGATHTAEDSVLACQVLADNINNYGIDLLYRCQGQSLKDWEAELDKCLSFNNMKHLSCYSLFLPNSDIQPNPEEDAAMAVLAYEYFCSKGFNHYASCATGGFDFAKPGYEGKYEKRHWEAPQGQYLGLGAGAFGYVNNFLTINYHDLKHYGYLVDRNIKPIVQVSNTSSEEAKHRYFVLGIKTMEVDLKKYSELFLSNPKTDFEYQFDLLEKAGLIELCDTKLKLSDVGRFYVDQISEVFWSASQTGIEHPETNELMKMEKKILNTTS